MSLPNNPSKAVKRPVTLKLIGLAFIANIAWNIFGAFITHMMTCFMGCNDLSPAYKTETIINIILMILAIQTAIGLSRRQYWAKTFGIILGSLLLVSDFAKPLMDSRSLSILLFLFLATPFPILNVLSVGVLV